MNNSKLFRLLMGMIILFSIFLFQGTDDLGGCSSCEGELGGSLTVINNTNHTMMVKVIPDGGSGPLATGGDSKVFYLDEGLYQVIGVIRIEDEITKELIKFEIAGVRMVDIKLGSNKTVTFTD